MVLTEAIIKHKSFRDTKVLRKDYLAKVQVRDDGYVYTEADWILKCANRMYPHTLKFLLRDKVFTYEMLNMRTQKKYIIPKLHHFSYDVSSYGKADTLKRKGIRVQCHGKFKLNNVKPFVCEDLVSGRIINLTQYDCGRYLKFIQYENGKWDFCASVGKLCITKGWRQSK